MSDSGHSEVTQLLQALRAGDEEARLRLFQLVYVQLDRIAAALMRGERVGHTFQTTDLVHEAFLRLFSSPSLDTLQNRSDFYATAARAMRHILVEHARKRNAAKRAGTYHHVPFDDVLDYFEKQHASVLDLDGALEELATLHERQAQVVVLRFFGNLSVAEVAEYLHISVATVETDYRMARVFLRRRLTEAK
jgi:RNA polymerase sigma factor (TIGR02999 family)